MTAHQMPKAAQKFIDDAKAAGLRAEVTNDNSGVTVFVKGIMAEHMVEAAAVWTVRNTYEETAKSGQLNFRTSGTPKPALRFSHGHGRGLSHGHVEARSLREVRFAIGLAI